MTMMTQVKRQHCHCNYTVTNYYSTVQYILHMYMHQQSTSPPTKQQHQHQWHQHSDFHQTQTSSWHRGQSSNCDKRRMIDIIIRLIVLNYWGDQSRSRYDHPIPDYFLNWMIMATPKNKCTNISYRTCISGMILIHTTVFCPSSTISSQWSFTQLPRIFRHIDGFTKVNGSGHGHGIQYTCICTCTVYYM